MSQTIRWSMFPLTLAWRERESSDTWILNTMLHEPPIHRVRKHLQSKWEACEHKAGFGLTSKWTWTTMESATRSIWAAVITSLILRLELRDGQGVCVPRLGAREVSRDSWGLRMCIVNQEYGGHAWVLLVPEDSIIMSNEIASSSKGECPSHSPRQPFMADWSQDPEKRKKSLCWDQCWSLNKTEKKKTNDQVRCPCGPFCGRLTNALGKEGEDDHQAHGRDAQRSLPSETTNLFLAPPDLSYPLSCFRGVRDLTQICFQHLPLLSPSDLTLHSR